MAKLKSKSNKILKKNNAPVDEESTEITLSDFIKENDKLISALGVFTALTIFSAELSIKPFGYGLSFAFITLTALLWLELWGKFPAKIGSSRLVWFENILFVTVVGIIFYWFLEFRTIWHELLQTLLSVIILSISVYPIRKFDLFNRVFRTQPGKLRFLRYLLGIVIGFSILFLSFYLANLIAPPLNNFLDQIKLEITTGP